jgi:hypothetical protein
VHVLRARGGVLRGEGVWSSLLLVGMLTAGLILGVGLTHWIGNNTAFGPGLSRAEAEQRARAADETVVSARAGRLREFEGPGGSMPGHDDQLVWAVLVSGEFQGSCGPAPEPGQPPQPCPPPAHTAMVVMDYRTGQGLFLEFPAPSWVNWP